MFENRLIHNAKSAKGFSTALQYRKIAKASFFQLERLLKIFLAARVEQHRSTISK